MVPKSITSPPVRNGAQGGARAGVQWESTICSSLGCVKFELSDYAVGDTGMSDFRFINKNGTSVDIATVRKRFFEAVLDTGVGPDKACAIWNDAVFGD